MPISRFADPALPTGGLTTSAVSVTTDARRDGAPVVGYGFGSFGRYAQSGLIRERFAPRLLAAGGALDPFHAWEAMMAGEKPGGHGERCVAVGWSLGSDERKHGAGTALFAASGELLGIARAVWIEPRG